MDVNLSIFTSKKVAKIKTKERKTVLPRRVRKVSIAAQHTKNGLYMNIKGSFLTYIVVF